MLKYTSSIKDMPLMFLEMKRTAILLTEGKTGNDIVVLSMDKNVYQLEKPKRRRDVPLRMVKRLSGIGPVLIERLAHGRDDEGKLIAFFVLMKADRLLFEYMREVYSNKYLMGYNEITDRDFSDFIDRKTQESETVAKWSAANLVDIRGKIKSSLCEAGLAKRSKGKLLIQKPLYDRQFLELFNETDDVYMRAMLIQ
jgi:hypothetical protein